MVAQRQVDISKRAEREAMPSHNTNCKEILYFSTAALFSKLSVHNSSPLLISIPAGASYAQMKARDFHVPTRVFQRGPYENEQALK